MVSELGMKERNVAFKAGIILDSRAATLLPVLSHCERSLDTENAKTGQEAHATTKVGVSVHCLSSIDLLHMMLSMPSLVLVTRLRY